MKLRIENLGILHHADLELGDLTVVCGKNNTGKTYATYALYGLIKTWRRLAIQIIPQNHRHELSATGKTTFNLDDVLVKKWSHHVDAISERFKGMLPAVLAADVERFVDTKIQLDIPPPKDILATAIEGIKGSEGRKDGALLSFKKAAGRPEITFTVLKKTLQSLPTEAVDVLANEVLQDYFFASVFPEVFMASTERTGAAIFQGELNFSRTRLLEALATTIDGNRKLNVQDLLPALLPEFNPRYAFPVRDNVDFINQLGSLASQKSPLACSHPDILKDFQDIIDGEYKVSRNVVYFVTKRGKVKLTLGESSSAVRSLLDIGFYLQHQAKKGDLFMIDEPELNLHPENQRRVARLLARLVNLGVKVFITTHSDYIAKEFNTLTLLGRNNDPEFAKKFDYRPDEVLDGSKVRLFVAQPTKAKKNGDSRRSTVVNAITLVPPLEDGGFDWPTFDPTIEDQTRVQRKIWEALNP